MENRVSDIITLYDGLKGYSMSQVNVQRAYFIYSYGENGNQLGSPTHAG